jgi:hypothetical protein
MSGEEEVQLWSNQIDLIAATAPGNRGRYGRSTELTSNRKPAQESYLFPARAQAGSACFGSHWLPNLARAGLLKFLTNR